MLINLSNHPSKLWQPEQYNIAIELYGEIEDIPFPAINPKIDSEEVFTLATEYFQKIKPVLENNPHQKNAVHLMGELTFCFSLLKLLQEAKIDVIASTTARDVKVDETGNKVSIFKFVRFRSYK